MTHDPAQVSGNARRSGQILLAEDNDDNARLASALLEAADYAVIRAEDGAKAVQAAREWAFDLVLMDVRMPVIDGLQATRMIRALGGPASVMPIIALTANTMRADREKCLAAGMDDFITKPIMAEAFLEVVARYVSMEGVRPDAGAHPDLDRSQLDNLARLLRPDDFETMARDHLVHADDLLRRMGACVAAGDLAALGAAAHACRGSWAEFGGRRVQHLAGRLERACREGGGEAAALVREVQGAAEIASALLGEYLAARPKGRRTV